MGKFEEKQIISFKIILKNITITRKMAKIFLLLATIFILANAGPLKRKLAEQIPLSGEDEDNARKRNIFNFGDQNGDGQMSFEEFVALTANILGYSEKQVEKILVMPEIREIFEQFDTNEDGQWSFEEFEVAYDSHDNETYRKMKIVEFKLMDSNEDGLVDFDEFVDFHAEKVGMNKEERDQLAQNESTHLAFERADRNGDGKIEMNEIVEDEKTPNSTSPSTTLSTSPTVPSFSLFPGSPEELFGQIDKNGDGILVYKECMDYMVEIGMGFSENQIDRMEKSSIPVEIFEAIDGNKDGQISMEELKDNYLEIMSKSLAKRIVTLFFNMADENENGLVDYEEFVDWVAEQKDLNYQERNELAKDEKLRAQFDRVDTDGDGQISLKEHLSKIFGTGSNEVTSTMPSAQSTHQESVTTTPVEETTSTTMNTTPEQSTEETASTLNTAQAEPEQTTQQQEESTIIPPKGRMSTQFAHFDENNDGQWELDEALNFYGNLTELGEEEKERVGQSKSFKKIFDSIDANSDGKLCLMEFTTVMEMDDERILEVIFKVVDEDEDGFVEIDELIAFIGDMRGLSDEERERMVENGQIQFWFDGVDKNGNGKLELEESKEEMRAEKTKKMIQDEIYDGIF